ncbi:hypothetical protein COU74_04415 [Candidatus Peregrinibacteria bacterium CG10_big_fil_rev_8_21_14_0_10_36_19]|nr:MAG: hypothetical protein COU74_04415 [Candidatus Peregrinibacteria bacterium CG10_big_fil_rev_8_21_14_0_10_36_19]
MSLDASYRKTDGGISGYRVMESASSLDRAVLATDAGEELVVCQCNGMADKVRACMVTNSNKTVFPSYQDGGPIVNEVLLSCGTAGNRRITKMASKDL